MALSFARFKSGYSFRPVIPAQAGIQQEKQLAQRTQPCADMLHMDFSINWIPACAGMMDLRFIENLGSKSRQVFYM
jgi:hypothetical protein